MALVGLTADASSALDALEAFGSNGTPATKFSSAIALTPIPGAQLIAAIPSLLKLAGFGTGGFPNPLPTDRWDWYQPGGMLWGVPIHDDDTAWATRFTRLIHEPGTWHQHTPGRAVWTQTTGESKGLLCKPGGGLSGMKDLHLSCAWKEWHLRGRWREAFFAPDGTPRWGFAPDGKGGFLIGRFKMPGSFGNTEVSEKWLTSTIKRVKSMRQKHEGKPPVFIDIDARPWLQFARGAFAHHMAVGSPHGAFEFLLSSEGKKQLAKESVLGHKLEPNRPFGPAQSTWLRPITDQFKEWLQSEHGQQARDFYEGRKKNHAARREVETQAWHTWKAQLNSPQLVESAQQEIAAKIPPSPPVVSFQTFAPATPKPAGMSTPAKAAVAIGAGALAGLLFL